ncbi:lantibiotic dehydratase C-terminal domain-containing protein [Rugosimonospora africana]|uniref:Lantibiotic biosynthesis protein n=1 Tax=Rugosimonospora africana TaxID=556532 RepID=A0A8J3VW69_9ACTN|nr:lantibiotic dehydratase C-terminal domain-containing protein [Rugosimonospora africana]GIH20428.1 lantibiotic biosynthesis protein [Rugosimonospora africana]
MAAPSSTTDSTDSDARPKSNRPQWLSLHVFYAGDQDRLLVDGVSPIVRSLRECHMIASHFFIRYWQEGPHVRLRLLPAPGVAPDVVAAEAEAYLAGYLAENPVPDPPARLPAQTYRRLFLAEYDQLAWDRLYGRDGEMPVRDNNSVRRMGYEPEYARYGGPAGIELAEWHFEASSDLVLGLLAAKRPVQPARLGISAQLGLILCLALLGDVDRVVGFLDGYRNFWVQTYGTVDVDLRSVYRTTYAPMAARLRRRANGIRDAVLAPGGDGSALTGPSWSARGWLAHCRALRRRLVDMLATDGVEVDTALPRLLHSYLHMTNDRLDVSVFEGSYLADALCAALTARSPGQRAWTTKSS